MLVADILYCYYDPGIPVARCHICVSDGILAAFRTFDPRLPSMEMGAFLTYKIPFYSLRTASQLFSAPVFVLSGFRSVQNTLRYNLQN